VYQLRATVTVSIIYIAKMSVINTLEDLSALFFIAEKDSETTPSSSRRDTEEIVEQETDKCGIYPYIKKIWEMFRHQRRHLTIEDKIKTNGHKFSL
jgi:hypothetical protein